MKDYSELKILAEAATPQDFDSAQVATHEGWIECPTCGGEGSVDLGGDYLNYDNEALGVQFYGIGDAHVKAEDYYRAANPAAVLALIAEVEALKAERDYCRRVADHNLDLGVQYMNERDQAKTDNELLRAEINHLKQCPLYSTRMNSKRYLWLRDSHIGDDPESINLECGPNNGLDSAIDAAMSNKE